MGPNDDPKLTFLTSMSNLLPNSFKWDFSSPDPFAHAELL